jgi:hypothetical protein
VSPSILPFGLSTVVIAIWLRTSSSDRPLATSLPGSIWMRIAGFCWPPIVTWATPEIWLICRRHQHDRRIRRVDLAIGWRRRQVLR